MDDRVTYKVEPADAGYDVVSYVETGFGGPARNFIRNFKDEEVADAFAAGAQMVENQRPAKPVKKVSLSDLRKTGL